MFGSLTEFIIQYLIYVLLKNSVKIKILLNGLLHVAQVITLSDEKALWPLKYLIERTMP